MRKKRTYRCGKPGEWRKLTAGRGVVVRARRGKGHFARRVEWRQHGLAGGLDGREDAVERRLHAYHLGLHDLIVMGLDGIRTEGSTHEVLAFETRETSGGGIVRSSRRGDCHSYSRFWPDMGWLFFFSGFSKIHCVPLI